MYIVYFKSNAGNLLVVVPSPLKPLLKFMVDKYPKYYGKVSSDIFDNDDENLLKSFNMKVLCDDEHKIRIFDAGLDKKYKYVHISCMSGLQFSNDKNIKNQCKKCHVRFKVKNVKHVDNIKNVKKQN